MLKSVCRVFRKIYYAILLARIGGLRALFAELTHHIYSRATYLVLGKSLVTNAVRVQCRVEYTLGRASEQDMDIILQQSKGEDKESVHELIQRKWFYESGFHDCYVAKTKNSGEICYMAWLLSSNTDSIHRNKSKLPSIKEDEILLENSYTFKKYRGNGIMPSAIARLADLARRDGFKRMITYVRQDNIASLKGCEKVGFHHFDKMRELRLLFFAKRNREQRETAG